MYKKIALFIIIAPLFVGIAYAVVWMSSEADILPELFYAYFFKISNFFFQIDSLLWGHGFLILGTLYLAFVLSNLAIWIYRKLRKIST